MIEVRHLTKQYDEHTAVEDLSFVVEDGIIYGFLGPNGAGKTTTMNIMTGYLSPTEGEVRINGFDILEQPEAAKRTIGYLPEVPPVYPDMTVFEYLSFAAELKKVPAAARAPQIEEILGQLSLAEVRDRLIRNLSKGYRQRTGLAQALLGKPETLILDEPTVGLDPKQILEMRELIRSLGGTHTVILSSHILSEVAEVCDRVLILNEGRLAACDTPENLRRKASGLKTVYVTAEGSREQVLRVLRSALSSAPEIEITDENGAEVSARITYPGDLDLRREIGSSLFEAGCPVLELRTEEESLEEIFLMLTDSASARPLKASESAEEEPEAESADSAGQKEEQQ